jgi:hypothetical protein
LGVELNPLGLPGATFTAAQGAGTQIPSGPASAGATGQPAPQGQPSTPGSPTLAPQPPGPGESEQQPAPEQQ